jgi:hypothetical protein
VRVGNEIFLSNADKDWRIAGFISQQLDRQGHDIFNWRKPGLRGRGSTPAIEELGVPPTVLSRNKGIVAWTGPSGY